MPTNRTTRLTSDTAARIPHAAVTSGRPVASTDPNATSSTTMAAAKPTVSDEKSGGSANTLPPSSTRAPGMPAAATCARARAAAAS